MSAPFELTDMQHADTVFSGKLIDYKIVSPGRPNSLDEYALLKVRVGRVFKGVAAGEVQLYWWNSTFGMPRDLDRSRPVLIAAIKPGTPARLSLRGPSATMFSNRRPDLLQVMQAPCSSPFILDYATLSTKEVRRAIKGRGKVAPTRNIWLRRRD